MEKNTRNWLWPLKMLHPLSAFCSEPLTPNQTPPAANAESKKSIYKAEIIDSASICNQIHNQLILKNIPLLLFLATHLSDITSKYPYLLPTYPQSCSF